MSNKKSYEKYLHQKSAGTTSIVAEAFGHLLDLKSPADQGLEEVTSIKLADETTVDVPTGWLAIIVTDEGEEVTWRWPGHLVDDTSELGINIIDKDCTLAEVFDPDKCWHFYRDDSRRAHVELVED